MKAVLGVKRAALLIAGLAALSFVSSARATNRKSDEAEKKKSIKLRFTIGTEVVTATIEDNATSRDFISLLPLTLTFKDFSASEKTSYLPRKLDTKSASVGSDPDKGDISYYAPWGNLVLFYKDIDYSNALIKLGKFDGNVKILETSTPVTAKIELLK